MTRLSAEFFFLFFVGFYYFTMRYNDLEWRRVRRCFDEFSNKRFVADIVVHSLECMIKSMRYYVSIGITGKKQQVIGTTAR